MCRLALTLSILTLMTACVDHTGAIVAPQVTSNVLFETRTEVPLDVSQSVDVAFVDLDRDGDNDMLQIGLEGELVVSLNDGAGTFTEGRRFDAPGDPLALRTRDLNGDRLVDVVLITAQTNVARVFLNTGNGGLTLNQVVPVPDLPTNFGFGDFTGDGTDDLVVAHLSRSDVVVFRGDGIGNFFDPISLPLPRGSRAPGLAIADLDENGSADIIVSDADNDRVVVLRGDSGRLIGEPLLIPVGETPVAVSVANVHPRPGDEILVSNFNGQTIDVLGRSGDSFAVLDSIPMSGQPANSTVGDIDGDGLVDLAVCILDCACVSILLGTPSGLSHDELQKPSTGYPFRPAILDLVGDERPELVVVPSNEDRINVYLGTPTGPAGASGWSAGSASVESVLAADLDGDGTNEVIVGGTKSTTLAIMRPSDGPDVLAIDSEINVGLPIGTIYTARINDDDAPDIIATVDGGVQLLLNESSAGQLAFRLSPGGNDVLAPGTFPSDVGFGDITGDGTADMIFADFRHSQLFVMPGRGNGEFDTPVRVPTAAAPTTLSVGEFDGDSELEIAIALQDLNQLVFFEWNGSSLTRLQALDAGRQPTVVRSLDLDRDGRNDLVVTNPVNNSVSLFVAQPDGGFTRRPVPTARGAAFLAIQDVDGDLIDDIVTLSLTGYEFEVMLGNGTGGIARRVRFPGVYAGSSLALTQVTGSDLPDLVIGSLEGERVVTVRNLSVRSQ